MRKFLLFTVAAASACLHTSAQRVCGIELQRAAIIAHHPEAAAAFETERNSLQAKANAYSNNAAKKTTAASAIPVVFHIILDTAQFNLIGGTAGIKKRCDSQIAVLNKDYNRQNSDSTLIPAGFKPVYGSSGIKFGLAHTAPNGHGTPGYEVKLTSATGWTGSDSGYIRAKYTTSGGLDSWDATKYLNVWVINFSDVTGLLGITTPKSFTAWAPFTLDQIGVCISYGAFGKRSLPSDYYILNIDRGRTLTHEFGHYFNMRHIWGDDGGACPATGGTDDGFLDTPPQADNTYGNPALPKFDACSTTGNGIMCMNFMDYTDDRAMQMFTKNQASAMATNVATGGENYSLTQNPILLNYPTGIEEAAKEASFDLYPNPTNGIIAITIDAAVNDLNAISVVNTVGQQVMNINTSGQAKNFYSIDLSGMSKGIYFVRCTFASGSVTRKILLQ
jgi:hypothetical protein